MTESQPESGAWQQSLREIVGEYDALLPLPSGTSGQSFRVAAGNHTFVAKVFMRDAPVLLGASEQHRLLRQLEPLQIAPRPIGHDAACGLLVTEFLDGFEVLSPEQLADHDVLQAIAKGLHALHAVDAGIPAFAPLKYARRYIESIGGPDALSPSDLERYEELIGLSDTLEGMAACLCHNDLLAENMLTGRGLKFLDFDYAVMAPPVVDTASLVTMNGLGKADAERFIDVMYGDSCPFSALELVKSCRLMILLAHFWALAAASAGASGVSHYRI